MDCEELQDLVFISIGLSQHQFLSPENKKPKNTKTLEHVKCTQINLL